MIVATFLLIWSYRWMELRDLREHDKEIHSRLGRLLAGEPGTPGAIFSASSESDMSYVLSRSLFGSTESSARLFCPVLGSSPIATGGVPVGADRSYSKLMTPSAKFHEIFDDTGPSLLHVSSWPAMHSEHGSCRIEIMTNLDDERSRISERSIQIALSSAVLEGFLLLFLLWIARRGDARLVESEKEQQAMESELFFLAHYDTLTHLPNRSLFWERLDAALGRAGRLGKTVCLVLVDLRSFTQLNEEEGRAVGDRALVEAARRIQASTHSSDLVCRLGSDKFAVLLEDLEPESSVDAANRLSVALSRQFAESWADVCSRKVRVNCGGSVFPHDGANSEDLLACAQQAAKRAKDLDEHLVMRGFDALR